MYSSQMRPWEIAFSENRDFKMSQFGRQIAKRAEMSTGQKRKSPSFRDFFDGCGVCMKARLYSSGLISAEITESLPLLISPLIAPSQADPLLSVRVSEELLPTRTVPVNV